MADYEETTQAPGFKDRKTWLVVFGVLMTIFGGFCLLVALFMLLGTIATTVLENNTSTTMSLRTVIPGILIYVVFAAWFIWMGIGSIKARRWARALILTSSWIWLISGIVGIIFMFVILPDMYAKMGESRQLSQGGVTVMKFVMTCFMLIFFLVIPGVFVLFYGSKNVKATCELRDAIVRWTDKCPLPVLALTLIFSFGAFFIFNNVFYGGVVPFFGFIISGVSGTVILLAITALLGYLARGLYNLNINALWGAFVLVILGGISAIVTFLNVSLFEFYEKMNIPAEQMGLMKQYNLPDKFSMSLYAGLWIVGLLGYLLYIKRYSRDFSIQGTPLKGTGNFEVKQWPPNPKK